ncbi:MAG TPA: NHLP bacteriocin system secretion protein [Coleofasciculaceae cyanobacterium]|jgi:HlyD family secretion protein
MNQSSKNQGSNQGNQKLFRREAVERLSSPEQLDQLVEVVSPKAWLPLTAIAGLVIMALLWSVFGRLPITVTGQGVLVRPRRVVQFQSPSSGQLLVLNIQPGSEIRKGDLIGTIDQSAVQQQLQQEQQKLADLTAQTQKTDKLRQVQTQLQQTILQQQQEILETNLQNARTLSPILRDKGLTALQENRKGLELRLSQLRVQLPELEQRLEGRRQLLAAGAISVDALSQFQQEYFDRVAQLADLEAQLRQLDVKEVEAQLQFLQNQTAIRETQTQLQDLATQASKLTQQNIEESFNQQSQLKESTRRIAQLQLQLATQGKIISPYDGRALEVTAISGQMIQPGERLGSIQAENPSEPLVSLTFFPDRDGKQIKPGMSAQITPSVVKREQYGGIVGEVTDVAPFPVTAQSITALVGNADLANQLAGNSAPVQITVLLKSDPETESGYAWSSSKGPNQRISSGTTASVQVKIGEIAPIAYVIPIFRSWTGIY